jgi:hypothetical protein
MEKKTAGEKRGEARREKRARRGKRRRELPSLRLEPVATLL